MKNIKKQSRHFIIFVLLLIPSFLANSQSDIGFSEKQSAKHEYQTISIEYMTGVSDMHGLRLAYRPDNKHHLNAPFIGDFQIEWEISLNLFDLHGSAKNEATYGLSISPVLQKEVSWFKHFPVIFEAGIGLAYVHDQKFGGVNIGSDYQFEDRLGLFTYFMKDKTHRLGFRLIHYSNGGLNTKNPGLDFFSFVYQKRF